MSSQFKCTFCNQRIFKKESQLIIHRGYCPCNLFKRNPVSKLPDVTDPFGWINFIHNQFEDLSNSEIQEADEEGAIHSVVDNLEPLVLIVERNLLGMLACIRQTKDIIRSGEIIPPNIPGNLRDGKIKTMKLNLTESLEKFQQFIQDDGFEEETFDNDVSGEIFMYREKFGKSGNIIGVERIPNTNFIQGVFIGDEVIQKKVVRGKVIEGKYVTTEIEIDENLVSGSIVKGKFVSKESKIVAGLFESGTKINNEFVPSEFINGEYIEGKFINGKFVHGRMEREFFGHARKFVKFDMSPEGILERRIKSFDNESEASHHHARLLDHYLKQTNNSSYKSAALIETDWHTGLAFRMRKPSFVLEHRETPSINVYFCGGEKIVLFETR